MHSFLDIWSQQETMQQKEAFTFMVIKMIAWSNSGCLAFSNPCGPGQEARMPAYKDLEKIHNRIQHLVKYFKAALWSKNSIAPLAPTSSNSGATAVLGKTADSRTDAAGATSEFGEGNRSYPWIKQFSASKCFYHCFGSLNITPEIRAAERTTADQAKAAFKDKLLKATTPVPLEPFVFDTSNSITSLAEKVWQRLPMILKKAWHRRSGGSANRKKQFNARPADMDLQVLPESIVSSVMLHRKEAFTDGQDVKRPTKATTMYFNARCWALVFNVQARYEKWSPQEQRLLRAFIRDPKLLPKDVAKQIEETKNDKHPQLPNYQGAPVLPDEATNPIDGMLHTDTVTNQC